MYFGPFGIKSNVSLVCWLTPGYKRFSGTEGGDRLGTRGLYWFFETGVLKVIHTYGQCGFSRANWMEFYWNDQLIFKNYGGEMSPLAAKGDQESAEYGVRKVGEEYHVIYRQFEPRFRSDIGMTAHCILKITAPKID